MTLYISEAFAQLTPSTTDDPTALGVVTAEMTVWDAFTGGNQVTALSDAVGNPVTTVSPVAPTYQCIFNTTNGYSGALWLAAPDGVRRLVNPTDLASRQGVSSWDDLEDKPVVIAAGATKAEARTAIGALSNVYWMPIWDGTGEHPIRPTDLGDEFYLLWRQPAAPLAGGAYARTGDGWVAI